MKTLLALLMAASPHTHAAMPDCWIPVMPTPCTPHLVDGDQDHNRAELLRCVLADNTALRGYVRSANRAIVECAGSREVRPVAAAPSR